MSKSNQSVILENFGYMYTKDQIDCVTQELDTSSGRVSDIGLLTNDHQLDAGQPPVRIRLTNLAALRITRQLLDLLQKRGCILHYSIS